MSVILSPSTQLGFNRPFNQVVRRTLTVSNPNGQAVAFKVKTTAPKLYCVRPNSGRIEPGQSVDVLVLLQAMKEEPPLNTKCKDKFLVQSTIITPSRESRSLNDIWTYEEGDEDTKVHQQKIKVVYLAREDEMVIEEQETIQHSVISENGDTSKYDTVRQHSSINGHSSLDDAILSTGPFPRPDRAASISPSPDRPASPPGEYTVAQEDVHIESQLDAAEEASKTIVPEAILVDLEEHQPAPAPAPAPVPVPVPEPIISPPTPPPHSDMEIRYAEALAEIQHLRTLLDSASSTDGLRRRGGLSSKAYSVTDDGGSVTHGGESDDEATVTMVDSSSVATAAPVTEGVPPQVVAIISLMVFLMTYLFF